MITNQIYFNAYCMTKEQLMKFISTKGSFLVAQHIKWKVYRDLATLHFLSFLNFWSLMFVRCRTNIMVQHSESSQHFEIAKTNTSESNDRCIRSKILKIKYFLQYMLK